MVSVVPKWIVFGLLLASIIGFFDATYLAAEHYLGGVPPCFIATGCEEVTTSKYSVVFGIPVALLGAVYYLVLFLLSIKLLESDSLKILKFISYVSGLGFFATIYFVYLQLFVINAICTYCMLSAASTTIIFVLSLVGIRQKYEQQDVVR